MRDRHVMFANIGKYCLIEHSLGHSPFNLGTVKKTSNITMKQDIHQSEYARLPSSWLIPTSWYAMTGSLHTHYHYFHSIERSLVTAIWDLSWCYQFKGSMLFKNNFINQKHMWREPTLLIWVAFVVAVWLFLGLIIDCDSMPCTSTLCNWLDCSGTTLLKFFKLYMCGLAQLPQEDSVVLETVSMMQFFQVRMHDRHAMLTYQRIKGIHTHSKFTSRHSRNVLKFLAVFSISFTTSGKLWLTWPKFTLKSFHLIAVPLGPIWLPVYLHSSDSDAISWIMFHSLFDRWQLQSSGISFWDEALHGRVECGRVCQQCRDLLLLRATTNTSPCFCHEP